MMTKAMPSSNPLMPRPLNDLFLKFRCEIHKIIGVSGNTDNKILMIFRVSPGILKGGLVHHIELDVMADHFKIGTDQVYKSS